MECIFSEEGLLCGKPGFEKQKRHETGDGGRHGGVQGENRARQKARHHEPSGAGDGCWNPECGEIHVYQFLRRKGVRQDRQQAGCHKGQAVDPAEQECRTSGHTWNLMAEV